MNGARKAIIADLRQRGFTGKQAYEASGDSEFMQQWVRVVVHLPKELVETEKTKPNTTGSWIANHLSRTYAKNAKKAAQEVAKASLAKRRARFIQKAMSGGLSLRRAMVQWDRQQENKK